MTDAASIARDLREWSAGWLALEAAVELLLRACNGRFAEPGNAWILQDKPGRPYWLDPATISHHSGCLSDGERRVLAVVQALATGCGVWDLGGVLAGLDRRHLALVLAAMAHAGGSHEHVDVTVTSDGLTWQPVGSLFPWPADSMSNAS